MENLETSTPYDDVCRTLTVECDDLVIPLINEIFGKDYVTIHSSAVHSNKMHTNTPVGHIWRTAAPGFSSKIHLKIPCGILAANSNRIILWKTKSYDGEMNILLSNRAERRRSASPMDIWKS